MPPKNYNTTPNEHWEITCERFVGFVDIMGFKDLVARKGHDWVLEKLNVISDYKNEIYSSEEGGYFSKYGSKLYIFSDSIIIFSKDDTEDEMKELFRNMRVLMMRLLNNSIPFSGAIAFGKITMEIKNSIFFGQPLIDAFLLSEELSLYAIALHHSAEPKSMVESNFNKRFIKFLTPMKNGAANHYLVSPFLPFFKKNIISIIIESYSNLSSGSLRRYIDNTKTFLENCREHQSKLLKATKATL